MPKLITKRTTTKQQTHNKQKPTAWSNPKSNNNKKLAEIWYFVFSYWSIQ